MVLSLTQRKQMFVPEASQLLRDCIKAILACLRRSLYAIRVGISMLKIAYAALAIFCAAPASYAGDWGGDFSVQINGVSRHSERRADGSHYNEVHTGIGVQYSQLVVGEKNTYVHLTGGTLINSMDDRSWYAGAGVTRRWGDVWFVEAGLALGIMSYPSYEHGVVIIPAPLLSFGTRAYGINAVYLPSVNDLPAAAFLQFRIGVLTP